MKRSVCLAALFFFLLLSSACSQTSIAHSDLPESHSSSSITSSNDKSNSKTIESDTSNPSTSTPDSSYSESVDSDSGSSGTSISDSDEIYFEVIATFQSEHKGLSKVELILDEVGYGLDLYFEPMDWDGLDNDARVEIAKSALEYAFVLSREYVDSIDTYAGYTNNGELIIFNNSSFYIVVMNTDGSNIHGTDIWP